MKLFSKKIIIIMLVFSVIFIVNAGFKAVDRKRMERLSERSFEIAKESLEVIKERGKIVKERGKIRKERHELEMKILKLKLEDSKEREEQ